MTRVRGASWATTVAFACRCGVVFRAKRWRWIDRESLPDEADRARHEGPLRGECPRCNSPAIARVDWLELEPSRERAVLILGPQQRHQLIDLLREHAASVGERIAAGELEVADPWLLRPMWRFEEGDTATIVRREISAPRTESRERGGEARVPEPAAPVREVLGGDVTEDISVDEMVDDVEAEHDEEDTARRRAPQPETDGVPRLVGSNPWPAPIQARGSGLAYVGMLTLDRSANGEGDEEIVTLDLELDEGGRSLWGQAALQVRPIHLREHEYPIIGVRLVASYVGRMSVIEGVVDVGSDEAGEVFACLSRRFRVLLVLRGEGSSTVRREVAGRDLERNAALCLESARASLARREYPHDAFRRALDDLGETELEDRLRGARHTLVAGAYRHLIAPRETWVALEHLEAASDKSNLAHLLEVDGLSVDEYESVRKRVLAASVEHGLCAPRRFWRRIIASGLADDFDGYAALLARARAEADQDGDDLDAEQRAAAWARIAELCDLKQLEYPPELRRKLGIGEPERVRRRSRSDSSETRSARARERAAANQPDPNRSRSVAGEIQARPGGRDGHGNLRDQLRDPSLRLRVASASLARGSSPEAIDGVFDVLDQFSEEELLAILPSIAELGTQAVLSLHAKLESANPQLRQAAAILLGLTRDSSSIAPLMRRLLREDSKIWIDVARAIGSLGASALERLCALVRQSVRAQDLPIERGELLTRVGRAMAEVVIAEGGPDSITRDTLETLAQSSETEVALAANRALATLHDVSLAGAQVRGERSLSDVTQIRGFARRAYEAITVPELDILDEEVEAELL
ncbi:hypothetical protein ACNOYE_38030 [Nannocystaceae bacterium ST9]